MIDLRIKIHTKSSCIPGLQSLMGKGIIVQIQGRQTLTGMLSEQLGIDSEYLKNRVQTIFLNSQPVDNADSALIVDGDIVALSAAMPGLVGATFRKGGHLAAFRERISHQQQEPNAIQPSDGTVTVRLFNVIAKELGVPLMALGQIVRSSAAQSFLELIALTVEDSSAVVWVDGKEASFEDVLRLNLSEKKLIQLRIGHFSLAL